MKRFFCVLLALGLLGLCACGKIVPEETTTVVTTMPTATQASTTTEAKTITHIPLDPPPKSVRGQTLNLPSYENNGGLYVYHNGVAYYRQYNEDCFEEIGEWGVPWEIRGAQKHMVRMDADSSVHELFEDDGTGGIYIDSKGNFYLHRELPDSDSQLYSLDTQGNVRWTASENCGGILAMDEPRGVLICAKHIIDCATGKITPIEGQGEAFYYDSAGGWVYCKEWIGEENHDEVTQDMIITRVNWRASKTEKLAAIPMRRILPEDLWESFGYPMDWVRITHSHMDGNDLLVYIETFNGNAQHFVGGKLLRMKNSGAWTIGENQTPADMVGLFTPFTQTPIQYLISDEVPKDYFLFTKYSGKEAIVLSQAEMASLGFPDPYETNEVSRRITDVVYAGTDIWFTARIGIRDPDYNRSGNAGYAIANTYIYRKNGTTGEIKLVYEY